MNKIQKQSSSIIWTLLLLCISLSSFGQSIKVKPYLQDASPNAIFIMWETDMDEESIVEWGVTESLGNTTIGTSELSLGTSQIHTVQLTGLTRFTHYYYRVITGDAVSDTYSFKTPPFASDHESFRIIAMSDMQQDDNYPNIYTDLINDGIITYLDQEIGGALIDNAALILIPGDLVDDGNVYEEWEETFFTPSENLLTQVPLYPVLGNHEYNTSFYFDYFHLPENGLPSLPEHAWVKDYGNVRIIGLDSNDPFDTEDQLLWLEGVLNNTCNADSIDFVIAQLHHPYKSELWTPGQSDYTGEMIVLLDEFSTNCGKPSIHLFGHTHAYSRGNSRDHKHLWINVATAGGAIDHWGEFPNFDYEMFSVSQDEYGFVTIDVTAGEDPKLVVKRISRGDQVTTISNELTDSVTIRLHAGSVDMPQGINPSFVEVHPQCVTLKASEFSSSNPLALHGQSHWQISLSQDNFSQPISESWKNYENWYYEEDTQAGDDMTDEHMIGLQGDESYWWRVRYRDRELNWSAWSTPLSFTTSASGLSDNLLTNAGAEDALTGWTTTQGVVESMTAETCDGTVPHTGLRYFAVGGVCDNSVVGQCYQDVDVLIFADSIDAGVATVQFGGYLSDYSGVDIPEMKLVFLDQEMTILDSTIALNSSANSWTEYTMNTAIPTQTRVIRMKLKGTRVGGEDNDSYFDDLYLKVLQESVNCMTVDAIQEYERRLMTLQAFPNPLTDQAIITLPEGNFSKAIFSMVDQLGRKVTCNVIIEREKIILNRGGLSSGTYSFWLKDKGIVIGKGRLVIQ